MMHDILQIVAIVGLFIMVMIQNRRIDTLELISKSHDKGIQDLYTRKANRKPGFETTIPPRHG